jgi:hypothetical protein
LIDELDARLVKCRYDRLDQRGFGARHPVSSVFYRDNDRNAHAGSFGKCFSIHVNESTRCSKLISGYWHLRPRDCAKGFFRCDAIF